jgi:hypothetical protein
VKKVLAFSTDKAEVVDYYRAWTKKADRWTKEAKKVAKQFCPAPGLERLETAALGSRELSGYKWFGPKADIPVGWRVVKDFWLVPKLSTTEGKAAKAAFAALGPLDDPRLSLPGIPHDWFGQLPAMVPLPLSKKRETWTALWIRYGENWNGGDRVDQSIWTPRSLAQYYAATEDDE